ncbi:hypothetical protein JP75_11540 [Devosia riboflavina]|uniref:Uncharacterized protein n=1 Tax=Devosia riboflavina TaxID=46914 RepID=A0A087M276_9HYPH|nr:hypothetical protein [Devosia riboflavina]KFL30979.1 hypothetical protein JP75_11540 [Devosia riboflavina]
MLEKLKGLLGLARTSTEIGALAAEVDIATLEASLAAARNRRAAALLDGSVENVLDAERQVDVARVNLERGHVMIEEIDRRRVDAEIAERKANFAALRADAQQAVEAAVARIEAEYPSLARKIVELARMAKAADAAALAWNDDWISDPDESTLIDPVGARLGWFDEFATTSPFYEAVSLPPVEDFGGFGDAGRWTTHTKGYVLSDKAHPSSHAKRQMDVGLRWTPEE